jgi:hypothetical protein
MSSSILSRVVSVPIIPSISSKKVLLLLLIIFAFAFEFVLLVVLVPVVVSKANFFSASAIALAFYKIRKILYARYAVYKSFIKIILY